MLKEEKFSVGSIEHCSSLSKGIECLALGGIDVVLSDLGLPDSQGLNTFEKLHSACHQVPIIILTGFNDDALALEAVRRGAQDYLIKGKFDVSLLTKAITYAIERKKLDEAVKRQADLIDLSPDAIIIKNPNGTVTFWSLGAEKLYGYTKAQAIGQKNSELFRTKSIQPLESIEAELKREGKWSGELFHRTKNGCELAIQSYCLAKFNERNEIIEIFEQNVDVTERKNAERLATIGATAGMVGHDIRNPLQAIAGEVFLGKDALKKLPDSEFKRSMKENLDNIDEQMSYIDKIVSDLQDYAKPLQPKFEEVNVKGIVEEVLSAINVYRPDREQGIQVKVSISEDLETLRTDEIYLRRILQNLINNSVQAMPNGGKLTVTASRQNGGAVISVQDTGVGIPAEIRTKLFMPLVTMKSKGQGFGLAVVKKFTEGLGGTISFESEIGKGTRFTVELPC